MLRSLFSGISGMKHHQIRMDVIGNNIANVNTMGYKTSRVIFKDVFSQTLRSGDGGQTPMQVGLGVSLASIDSLHTTGNMQATGYATDMALEGNGYFVLIDNEQRLMYTRVGNFDFDQNGYLVSVTTGQRVVGLGIDGDQQILVPIRVSPEQMASINTISVGVDGRISFDATEPIAFDDGEGNFTLDGAHVLSFLAPNPAGLEKQGDNVYRATLAAVGMGTTGVYNIDKLSTLRSFSELQGHFADLGGDLSLFTAETGILLPGSGGAGILRAGFLEMSNVDLTEEFSNLIVTQRGFQANSRVITTSDEILQELVNLKR